MVDFPTWFNIGWYGGLICCMFAIATNVLYSLLYQRGRTHLLAAVTVVCITSALLLLFAIIWFNSRFSTPQALFSVFELVGLLVYVALCGWAIPLGATGFYCLLAQPRSPATTTALKLASVQPSTTAHRSPRYQPGVEAPFVFSKDIPWGWLEYHSGNFQGQRLALKRAIVTIGRDEDCDIWLDDDMASRYHAELVWDNGQLYLTDCESLNGVLLNKQQVRGSVLLKSNDLLQIGTHSFVFILAEQKDLLTALDDPLSRHTWRSTEDLQTGVSESVSLTRNSLGSMLSIPSSIPQRDTALPVSPDAPTVPPPLPRAVGGPMPLKLPSKRKK